MWHQWMVKDKSSRRLFSLHHLRTLQAQYLEIFSTGGPLDSETVFSTINLCFLFIFIETFVIKCLTACSLQQIFSTSKSQQVLNEHKATERENGLILSKGRMFLISLNLRSWQRFLDQTSVKLFWAIFWTRSRPLDFHVSLCIVQESC